MKNLVEKLKEKIIENKQIRVIIVILMPLLLAICIIAYVLMNKHTGIGIVCQSKQLFNIDCAGCGVTRMIGAILELNIYQAFRWNPFMFISIPLAIIYYIYESLQYIKYCRLSDKIDKVLITYAIITVAFSIIRNIGVFRWLAPTQI